MLDLWATPVNSKLLSRAEILIGRPVATLLPSHTFPITVARTVLTFGAQAVNSEVHIWSTGGQQWSPTVMDMWVRVSLLSIKNKMLEPKAKQARPEDEMKWQGTVENQGRTMWEQTRDLTQQRRLEGIIIIIHSFYVVLFSALKQIHCAHWNVILNEWLYPFIAHIINIHGSGVLVAFCGGCMAGATWNAAVLAQVLCTPFNLAPGYSVTSFKAT